MRRLMLLALGLTALFCAAGAPSRTVSSDDVAGLAAAGSCLRPGESPRSGQSDQHYHPQQHAAAAVTQSIWKSGPVHAALAATPSARSLDTARAPRSHDPPVPSTPPFLRHTPLLI